CVRTLSADVVVLDQPLMYNRLGSQNVNGIVYALRRDVVSKTTGATCDQGGCTAGNVVLRPDKRPRPLVLRVAAGDCLDVAFQNLLAPTANVANALHPNLLVDNQVTERQASFHAQGLELRGTMQDDGSFVGANAVSGLMPPGSSVTYKYYAPREGTYLVTSHGATFGSDGAAGNSANGMFAVVNVEPPGAGFYRSQVTEEEMRLAVDTGNAASCASPPTPGYTCSGHPLLNYESRYPATASSSSVPSSTTSAPASAGATTLSIGRDPTTLATPFPAQGFVKLVPPGGSALAPETFAVSATATGFQITATGSATTAASVDVAAGATAIATAADPTALAAPFPAAGTLTLSSGGATSEPIAYTAGPQGFALTAGPAAAWPAGSVVTATDPTGAPISVGLTLAQAWPAGATVQNVDGQGNALAVNVAGPSVWAREGKGNLPILNMVDNGRIVHSDLNAIVTGGQPDGSFPPSVFPLESQGFTNPALPNRTEPFREYTVVFHDEMAVANAFPLWFARLVNGTQNPLAHTLHAVGDVFQINYGSGAIGPEVIASRLGVGPMHDCLDCVYEEFFLTSPAVGDPAMVVDIPATTGLEDCPPPGFAAGPGACAAVGPKATRAYYPDDPSNVHHSYIGDHVRFRNVHTGKEHHIFHLHNHQWLFNPNDDNSNYLDAQGIGPGAGYTYEINFGGSGNRNKSAGDAIFHCHFYPHFAQGMWELWRNHDVMEMGTPLQASAGSFHGTPFALQDGTPAAVTLAGQPNARARSLPDGEIAVGTPIPAVVPLPGKPMAPMPANVAVVPKLAADGATVLGSVARVERTPETDPAIRGAVAAAPKEFGAGFVPLRNPGFPFWLAGVESTVGQRMPSPPLDMAVSAGGWDGGLPRHALEGFALSGCAPLPGQTLAQARAACAHSVESRLDMTKEVLKAKAVWFPEEGTDLEKSAMAFHAVRNHATHAIGLDGTVRSASFVTNGSGRPTPGAPFHEPCIDDTGKLFTGVGNFFDGRGGTTTTGSSV
ncbi:MAG TPA: multicopper oxidase domain-containing protein, partial [Anaeromyxobacteraceae bacterium]|nr:multicopper oxidase domain-containing protein [Anaeromyxobacteraceae bacterium]